MAKSIAVPKKHDILPEEFFAHSTPEVARALLGKFLVRKWRGKEYAQMITEVEVYDGYADRASHAFRGATKRTQIMFDSPGVWYVYLIYGMYEMLNIVTREKGYPAAVLIRGVKAISGPGKLTRALHVTRAQNSKRAHKSSGLWIEDRGVDVPANHILRTPRIGVAYAGNTWAQKKWRFVLEPLSK